MPHMPRFPLALACAALLVCGTRAPAQDVKWRTDYAAARKEAAETGRALLLDFGTEACFWCKKMDATTLRDPKVAKVLNERFVPVKLDGNAHPRLTETLKVEGFPTLILATPDGKVIGRHAGYATVEQLTALLAKAPAPAPAPAPPAPKSDVHAALAELFPEIAAKLDR
jgi:thioredoxin-related protein